MPVQVVKLQQFFNYRNKMDVYLVFVKNLAGMGVTANYQCKKCIIKGRLYHLKAPLNMLKHRPLF
jgi:hypothetical protein